MEILSTLKYNITQEERTITFEFIHCLWLLSREDEALAVVEGFPTTGKLILTTSTQRRSRTTHLTESTRRHVTLCQQLPGRFLTGTATRTH